MRQVGSIICCCGVLWFGMVFANIKLLLLLFSLFSQDLATTTDKIYSNTNKGTNMKIYLELNTENDMQILSDHGIHISRMISCLGSYKGIVNPSVEIDLEDLGTMSRVDAFNLIMDIAIKYKQESILVVAKGKVDLVYMDSSMENIDLGNWSEVKASSIDSLEAWTYINNKFMVAA